MADVSETTKREKPNLYIVGFMGVGKSAIGRKVARALRYKFIDSDHAIEKKAGVKIAGIFANEGEAAFRKMEREFIETGHPEGGCVVSCGGGLVVQEGMSDLLKKKGVVVCLFASPESIVERTSRNANRPLLNVENPGERVRELLAEREPIYMNAGHVVRTYNSAAREFARG